jgi:hypothetical protein
MRRAWAGCGAAVLLALSLPGCEGRSALARDAAKDVVLLVGINTFAGGDRAARLLSDSTAATDVLGPARFELLAAAGARPADLPALLRERLARADDVRAVVAVLGDLTVLTGVDPSRPPEARRELTRREPRTDELLAARAGLLEAAQAHGATLLVATAPLGRQGRVEVPELLAAAAALREAGPVIDLQAAFLAHDDAPRFANGIDRLDDWGHDQLARELMPALLEALPPRDDAERVARLQARALEAFAQGREAEWRALLPEVRAAPAGTPRAAARRAALLMAADGIEACAGEWAAIDAGGLADVPGLAAGRLLAQRSPGDLQPRDEVEQGFVAVSQAIAAGSPSASDLALAVVDLYPERLEAWIALQLAGTTVGPPRDWRGPARRTLRLFEGGPVAEAQVERLLDAWPATLDALPALLCASRARAGQRPVGPLLETARRSAALGLDEHASAVLRNGANDLRLPPSWRELAEGWATR